MEGNTQEKTTAFSKKKLSFILPAVLTGLLVFDMIPQTQVTLQDIPERLALVEEVAADTGTEETAAGGLKRAENKEEDGEQAVGDYEDGVYTGTSQGYGGPVTVEVTVKDGQITDVKIVSAAGETEPYFSLAKSVIDQVKQKQTWEVDVASGATYSSRGILGAIQNALTGETVENAAAPKVEPKGTTQQDAYKDPDAYKDGTYTGTAQGFGGPITVKVVVKDGKIDSISIESAGGETSSYLSRAKGVISSILKKESPNVDTVSGATYSSTGIINAVKRALSKASADGSKKTKEKKQKKAKKKTSAGTTAKQDTYTEPAAYKDGTYYGTAEGFGGDIQVKVVISNGKLSSISIVSADDETKEYLDKAKAVIGTILQKGSPNVDSISGATFSSTGIINAVKRAMSQAAASGSSNSSNSNSTANNASSKDTTSGSLGETTPSDPSVMPAETLKDGVYTGTGIGYGGDITVQLTVSGGRMTDLTITSAEKETAAYFNRAKKLTASILAKQSAEVDVVSGATYSSEGIVEAVKNAMKQAAGKEPQETDPSGGQTGSEGGGTQTVGEGESGGGHSGGGAGGSGETAGQTGYKDGTYFATGWCVDDYGEFEYEVTVTIVVKDHVITRCEVSFGEDRSEYPEDNDYYIDRAINGTARTQGIPKQIISKQSAQSSDVDVKNGATYTSTTIRNLADSILSGIKVDLSEEETESKTAKAAKASSGTREEAETSSKTQNVGEADVPTESSAEEAGTAVQDKAENTENSPEQETSESDRTDQQDPETAAVPDDVQAEPETEEKNTEESEAAPDAEAETKKAGEEAKKKAEEAKKKAEEEAKKKAEAEAKKKAEEEAKKKAEEEAKKRAAEETEAKAKAAAQAAQAEKAAADDEKDT